MSSIADSSVTIQTSAQSVLSTPSWFGEAAVIAHYLRRLGVLSDITEHVRFARNRFGHYDLIDFAVVLLGYAMSGERTLEAFYERLQPFANAFMALFERDRLPHRSTLSRFLAALNQTAVESLRTLFLKDLLARPLEKEEKPGGLWDRQGTHWLVFDVDGTRQAARQRALPCTPDLPPAQRRLDEVCAPGYTGRKRGEVVRTRTTILQAHTHQWLGTFSGTSGAGNGDYRGELKQAVKAISAYVQAQSLPLRQAVVRLDGQYGNGAVLADLAGLAYVMRGKDYSLLDLPQVQARLARSPYQQTTHPETGTCRALFDCPDLSLTPTGPCTRVIVATHPATEISAKIGTTRGEAVYELFYTALPSEAFTPTDVVNLYLHRGAFECVLGDEDAEQGPDRWCSHTAWGQEFWLILAQWIWNLRLDLGHTLHPTVMRTTEFAPAQLGESAEAAPDPVSRPPELAPVIYGPPLWARPSYTKGFAGADFSFQSDGTLRCPAGRPLYAQERRPEHNGSLRVLYAARIGHCRSCPLREQCQESATTIKARRVSAVYWPVSLSASISSESPPAPGDPSPPSARVGETASSPARRYPTVRTISISSVSLYSTAFPRGASSLASFLERPPGAQCLLESSSRCFDHALRDTRRLCHFSRPPHRLSLAYRSGEKGSGRFLRLPLVCFPGVSCSLTLYPSLPSLPLYEIHSTHSDEREQGVFKPRDRLE